MLYQQNVIEALPGGILLKFILHISSKEYFKRKEHEMLSSNLDSFESEISKKLYILYILFFIY